jgi:hypothetical protein
MNGSYRQRSALEHQRCMLEPRARAPISEFSRRNKVIARTSAIAVEADRP